MNRKKELLTIAQEECAEITQAISKIFRFGEDNFHPKDKDKVKNINHLETEIGDLLAVLKFLVDEKHVNDENIMKAAEAKMIKLEEFMTNKSK